MRRSDESKRTRLRIREITRELEGALAREAGSCARSVCAEPSTEPAKLADRVIAPGEASAEPGVKQLPSDRAHEVGERLTMQENWLKSI